MKNLFLAPLLMLFLSCSTEDLDTSENDFVSLDSASKTMLLTNFVQNGNDITSACDKNNVIVFESSTSFITKSYDTIDNSCSLIATITATIDSNGTTFTDNYGNSGEIEINDDQVVLVYTGDLQGTVVTYKL